MKKLDIVIDTDTFNEVDDQFALAYALLSQDKINIKGVYAAPFHNKNSLSPKDGMQKSYLEILNIFHLLSIPHEKKVYQGSETFLKDEKTYVESPAVQHLIQLVLQSQEKIYVVAIAALTNVASAILLEPRIIDKISVIWLGGHDYCHDTNREFNLRQDVAAARVVLGSGVELTHIPCLDIVTHLVLTLAELEKFVEGKSQIGTYLTDILRECQQDEYSYARVIADLAAIAYVVHPEWFRTHMMDRPQIDYDLKYNFSQRIYQVRKVVGLNRNKIIDDLLYKVSHFKDK